MQKYSDFTIEHFRHSLKEFREQKGMSQSDLARATGMTPSTISTYEKGIRDPKCEIYCALADALNIDPIAFFATKPTMNLLESNDTYFRATSNMPATTDYISSRNRLLICLQEYLTMLNNEDLEALLRIVKRMQQGTI